jgi:hypothetical protein
MSRQIFHAEHNQARFLPNHYSQHDQLDDRYSITPLVQEMSTGDFRLYPDLVKAHLRSFRDITDLTTHDLF